jgi:hypothetical protein
VLYDDLGESKTGRKDSNKTVEWSHSSLSECNNWNYNRNINEGARDMLVAQNDQGTTTNGWHNKLKDMFFSIYYNKDLKMRVEGG